jgi:hypothetical protein
MPPTEPVEEGDEGVWDTMGEPAGSRSPAPTVEEILAQLERQPPAPQGSTEPVAAAVEEVVASGAQESTAPAAAAVEEAVAAGAQEEAPAEGGLVDIASILGAPAVTIVRSNLYVLHLPEYVYADDQLCMLLQEIHGSVLKGG